MKILDINKIHEADQFTIINEPISSIDLMERAGINCTKWIRKKLKKKQRVFVFVGPGNNGGDGLVIARQLLEKGYDLTVLAVLFTDNFSDDFSINLKRIKELKNSKVLELKNKEELPLIQSDTVIIDAIFGSGLNRLASGLAADCIYHINNSEAHIISIDIPSGLFADEYSDRNKGSIVQADYTLSLQFPKFSFMFPENEFYVGELRIIPIGLHEDYIKQVEAKAHLIEKRDVTALLQNRNKFSHKGTFGHGLLIAGSYGKMGAAVLAARASLKSGLGLLTAHIPENGVSIMQTAVPECMLSIDKNALIFSKTPDISQYNAIAIGPGLGTDKLSQNSFKLLIQNSQGPMVVDADALNILSENKTWLSFLPKNSILTPHPKEFERLAGKSRNSFERIQKQMDFARKYQVIVVLKGAYSSIATPEGCLYFNSTGNPGMATAGSGDVLTGFILGLLCQSYSPINAAILGVYLHGLAGDIASKKNGYEALIASDIVNKLGGAFLQIYK